MPESLSSASSRFTIREPINVLLIGGGGREHALASAIVKSKHLSQLHVTHPENPGLAMMGRPVDVPVDIREIYRLKQYIEKNNINLVVIGPEEPLAQGYADALEFGSTMVFGPAAAAAKLEADKAYSKKVMRDASIPTGDGRTFTDAENAISYIESRNEAPVVKAAGLAKGKGVIVAATKEEAIAAVKRIMIAKEFGDAGASVVIEEKLKGREASVLAIVDGRSIMILPVCQDHKRVGDGDTGPNTGGMGAFCPSDALSAADMTRVEREVFVPVVDLLRREGIEYRGVLYAGLMLTHGGPKVLEFNCRFGDPECQALVSRLTSDILELMVATCMGRLDEVDVTWDNRASCCIVLASEGYPDKPITGVEIKGIEHAAKMDGVRVDHAGTKRRGDAIVSAGGRVLNVTALGATVKDAAARAYEAASKITFPGRVMRMDIGSEAVGGVGGKKKR
jgi:phosphoribosylamine--glycine ligase